MLSKLCKWNCHIFLLINESNCRIFISISGKDLSSDKPATTDGKEEEPPYVLVHNVEVGSVIHAVKVVQVAPSHFPGIFMYQNIKFMVTCKYITDLQLQMAELMVHYKSWYNL